MIIPAHNEERHLPAKLANLAALEYPKDRLEILFVSDGSTDATNEILGRAAAAGDITLLALPARGGKASALNQAVARARQDILVFSDAATLFARDAVSKLVRHFADPRVGVVCGALQFQASTESRQTEGLYWRYESLLRLMESRIGVTLTASGAIYALRRACFVPLSADTLVEDLVVPMTARRLGFRVLYDPEARGTDFAASTVAGEFSRRVRIATGSFRALGGLLRGPLDPVTAFAFVSHKLLRWTLPFLLIGMLVTSAALLESPLYRALFVLQVLFYGWGLAGYLFRPRIQGIRFALVAYYLLAMHLAFLVGFVRYLSGRREIEWRQVH
jgi:cellulose synthase/poly-beta-1,6-N-acetylglucosamine synthase-like glycosyltransferase